MSARVFLIDFGRGRISFFRSLVSITGPALPEFASTDCSSNSDKSRAERMFRDYDLVQFPLR